MLADILAVLKQRLGNQCATGDSVRALHGRDYSKHPDHLPDAVVFAQSAEDVAAVVELCAQHAVPVVAFGVGSSLEGHILPVRGGISLDLSRMNRILEIRPDDLDVTVEPGVTRGELNSALRPYGLFFPVDPGADASLGGMAATGASGTMGVRYGTMRDQVRGLKFVGGLGQMVQTGSRARKSSAGYDLTRLMLGSEGTLGIITELTLRVFPLPEAMSAATCVFDEVGNAVRAVIQAIQLGLPLARAELLDELSIVAINRFSKLNLPAKPSLFLEFHGDEVGVANVAANMQEIVRGEGGAEFVWAAQTEDRTRLWQARHDAWFATLDLCPGARAFSTDVCVPISRLAECIEATRTDRAEVSVTAPLLGHVGDGNFHMLVLIDPANPRAQEEADWLNDRLVARALEMGGTCTGEHGVGLGKRKFMLAEHGAAAMALMKAVKGVFDPKEILNPGKIFLEG
jgi:D-lactate dehydrogenase (cytochrome)